MENRTLLLPVQQRLRAAAAAAADDDDDIILGSMSCVYAWITKQKQIKKKKLVAVSFFRNLSASQLVR